MPKVLLVVAHPVIGPSIETLLKLEGKYDVRRIPNAADTAKLGEWQADVAFVDGTLVSGFDRVRIGAPAYVLSGNETDGRRLARQLDDGRGWLRKDATGPEFAQAIASLTSGGPAGLGPLGMAIVVALSLLVLALFAYLVWLAVY